MSRGTYDGLSQRRLPHVTTQVQFVILLKIRNNLCQSLKRIIYKTFHASKRHTGIPGLWTQELNLGLWTLDFGRRTLNSGLWTLDARLWNLDAGLWTLDSGRWTLDAGRWKLKTLEARLWTLGIGCWILDVKTLRSTVNPLQANVLFLFNHLKI